MGANTPQERHQTDAGLHFGARRIDDHSKAKGQSTHESRAEAFSDGLKYDEKFFGLFANRDARPEALNFASFGVFFPIDADARLDLDAFN